MSNGNWLKLNRELFKKPIWLNSTPEQKVVLITLLGMVNHKEKQWEWQGQQFTCKAGQTITSLESIRQMCGKGITIQNVRTTINRLEKLEFLTNQSTKTGRLITIVNWGKYQDDENETNIDTNKDLTKTSQRPNKDLTTNKNDKECKNDKEYIYSAEIGEIINHLNQRTDSQYRASTKATRTLIQARLKEGFTVDDFKTVIDKKCVEWVGTEWEKFLRPQTLFGTKFESYLNAKVVNKQTTGNKFLDYLHEMEV